MPTPPQTAAARSRANDNAALLDRLLRSQHSALLLHARESLEDPQEAEDVVQAAALAFLGAFGSSGAFGGEAGALAYLKVAVKRHAWRLNRTRARRRRWAPNVRQLDQLISAENPRSGMLSEQVGDPTAEDPEERVIAALSARAAAAGLSERQRAALLLRAAGFPTAEIAAALQINPRMLRREIERGNRALREAGGR